MKVKVRLFYKNSPDGKPLSEYTRRASPGIGERIMFGDTLHEVQDITKVKHLSDETCTVVNVYVAKWVEE